MYMASLILLPLFQVEHIIREENMMAAQEILELFCELISVRLPIIESQRLFLNFIVIACTFLQLVLFHHIYTFVLVVMLS